MDSAAPEARLTAPEWNTDESRSLMALLPLETKIQIMSYISTQQSLSRLSQSCRAWYGPATQKLYTRDAKRHSSFAIKWMAAHAVDEQTTDSAIGTLETSRRWGGEIDAIQWRLPPSDGTQLNKDQAMYGTSTALHIAVFLGNIRLVETLLDMKASLTITCRDLIWKRMGSEKVLRRVSYFESIFKDMYFGAAFPIFLAFLKSDPHMCKLLAERGAGREAWNFYESSSGLKALSILHFAAADPTTDYRQWQCLFDGFREYIDEPCPRDPKDTPLHVALKSGCTQGMQIAVESGADKEASNFHSHTPLYQGIRAISYTESRETLEKPITCLRKFVELGASVNSEAGSVLVLAVEIYAPNPVNQPNMRQLIYFLLDHHADVHGTTITRWKTSNVVHEIVLASTSSDHKNPLAVELLKELLSDLLDRGFNLRTPDPKIPSPLYCVLNYRDAKPKWIFDFLCENGAAIHEREVDSAFIRWCEMFWWWRRNENSAWWKHQGQEDKVFLKWCEDPFNAWWWQHVEHISPDTVSLAYEEAFAKSTRQLYDILTHLPLPAPSDDLLIGAAFNATKLWCWRIVVHREFEDNFLATWSFDEGENMIHLTVRKYVDECRYAPADMVLDIVHLRDKGVNIRSPNSHGQTPLDLLLKLGSRKDAFLELVTLLEGKMGAEGVLETTT
ncbi:uncharacterized protein CPUR_05640 [Claviceps purpurea 20.1]|uniref:F-box domain-containing protein n=1 Tax=Claviceps purpurea (strain 20.1) TaxID=1111077 RepID=M1W8C5_CLAP2|nr:uncharacterized protein CPUR_05640 [Claviceps purpurea 20.1]